MPKCTQKCQQIFFQALDGQLYAPDTIILKNYVRSEGHSDTKMVCDTPLSPDTFTHTKFGNPISKNIKDMRRTQCGPDSKN